MDVIYIDALFALNLLADYLLCLSAGRICGLYLRRRRYLLAAALGAVYAAAVWLPGLAFLAAPPLRLAAGVTMGLVAFGADARPLRCTGVLLAVSAAFGGALWALSLAAGGAGGFVPLSTRTLLLAFALCYAALRLLFRLRGKRAESRRAAVTLGFHGRESRFTALIDSGNSLSDPLTGAPVLIASPRALREVLREDAALFAALSAPELLSLLGDVPAWRGQLRLLPYRTLDGGGLLAAFKPDRLAVDGRPRPELLVAVSPHAEGEDYQGIL